MSSEIVPGSFRSRKSVLLGKQDDGFQPVPHGNVGQQGMPLRSLTSKQRWSACFSYIFKRNKTKADACPLPTSPSASTLMIQEDDEEENPSEEDVGDGFQDNQTATTFSHSSHHPCHSKWYHPLDHVDHDPFDEKFRDIQSLADHDPLLQHRYGEHCLMSKSDLNIENSISDHSLFYGASLPPIVTSSLSPPPRHVMNRQGRAKSLIPLDSQRTSASSTSSSPVLPSMSSKITSSTPLHPSSQPVLSPPPPPSTPAFAAVTDQALQPRLRPGPPPSAKLLRLSLDLEHSHLSWHEDEDAPLDQLTYPTSHISSCSNARPRYDDDDGPFRRHSYPASEDEEDMEDETSALWHPPHCLEQPSWKYPSFFEIKSATVEDDEGEENGMRVPFLARTSSDNSLADMVHHDKTLYETTVATSLRRFQNSPPNGQVFALPSGASPPPSPPVTCPSSSPQSAFPLPA
ncbi:hypothetical protein DM01DRAFT_1381981 [Hesseltinella vesiculosa]|uniref:Uncharacterized protein n=1 Tax=Hesseltinella vesiculosa TaxID=101127 RepID=A0A1X2GMI0_9FUNG|nr:hypothetical protein DM01DRAFT_1381981 [Hesseltinella vesiculosa]